MLFKKVHITPTKTTLFSSFRTTLYHGTTSLNLSSIIQHGLSPDKVVRPSIGMRKTAGNQPSFGGVYLAFKDRAIEYAKSQAKQWGGYPLLVVVSFEADEFTAFDDDVTLAFTSTFVERGYDRKKYRSSKQAFSDHFLVGLAVDKAFQMVYGTTEGLSMRVIGESGMKRVQEVLVSDRPTMKQWDMCSREYGKMIPFLDKKVRNIQYDPYRRLRYLKVLPFIGGKGASRNGITDLLVLKDGEWVSDLK